MNAPNDPCQACPVSNLRRGVERERELRRSGNPDPVIVGIVIALMNALFLIIGFVLGAY